MTYSISRWDRFGPLAGVAAVVFMVVAFIVAGNTPDTTDDDTTIANYFAQSSHQTEQIIGGLLFLIGVMLLICFAVSLRNRVAAVDGGGTLGSLVLGAGVASAVFWLTAIAFFVGPAATAGDTDKFQQAIPNIYRVFNDTGYLFWVAAVMTGALLVWATAGVAFRTGLLPRWFGWVSVVVGGINLLALFFVPAFLYWLWIVVAAILIYRTPAPAPPAAGTAGTPVRPAA
jgi:hypothetical protein